MTKKHRSEPPRPVAAPRPVVEMPESRLNVLIVITLFLLPLVFFFKYIFGGAMLDGTDWLGGGAYAAHQFMAEYIKTRGAFAFWQPHILCGQPTAAAFFGDMFYWPLVALRLILPVYVVWTWTFVLHLFAAGLGTWLFLRELKVGTIPAALGGVAYMFAGSLVTLTYAGHDGRLIGSALLPLALFFLHRGMTTRRFIQFLLCGLVVGMQLLSGHVQKVYYTGLVLCAYALFMAVRAGRDARSAWHAIRLLLLFGVGMAFAGAFAAIQYLPIYGNLPYGARGAERGYDFATSWSMPIAETFDLLTPKFSGGLENYWSRNPFKLHSEYLGILPLLFAFIAIVRCWRRPPVRFFFFTTLGGLLMAWGGNTPFYRLVYLLPGVSRFRGPAMIFFTVAFSLAVLAGFGVAQVLSGIRASAAGSRPTTTFRQLRPTLYAGFALTLLLFFALVGRGALAGLLDPGQRAGLFEANYPEFTIGLLFAVLVWTSGVVLAWLAGSGRLRPLAFASIAAAVMVLDIGISLNLWNGKRGYIRGVPPPHEHFAADDVVRALGSDTSLYRVLPLNYRGPGRDYSREGMLWLHNIQSVGGELPNPLQSYQDFIGSGQSVMFQAGNMVSPNFLNLMNVKYVIGPTLPDDVARYDEQSRRVIAQLKFYFSQPWFEPVHIDPQFTVYRNRNALPRAFVVRDWQVVRNKHEVIAALLNEAFDPSRIALLYEEPGLPVASDSAAGAAHVASYDANRIAVSASLSAPGILVLSENWLPDWCVYVDGRPARMLRAFHTLRAVALETGEHEVEFRYESKYYRLGALISLLATILFALVALLTVASSRRRALPPTAQASAAQ